MDNLRVLWATFSPRLATMTKNVKLKYPPANRLADRARIALVLHLSRCGPRERDIVANVVRGSFPAVSTTGWLFLRGPRTLLLMRILYNIACGTLRSSSFVSHSPFLFVFPYNLPYSLPSSPHSSPPAQCRVLDPALFPWLNGIILLVPSSPPPPHPHPSLPLYFLDFL